MQQGDPFRQASPSNQYSSVPHSSEVKSIFDIADAGGQPYTGSLTSLAVSLDHQAVWGCGRRKPWESWSIYTFKLSEIKGADSGTVNMCGTALPHMLKVGTGHIINISSDAARTVFPALSVYCASKAFVQVFT